MTKKQYKACVAEVKNHQGMKELETILEPKTILGMFKWVCEHADYLIYFEGYNENKVKAFMSRYGKTMGIINESTNKDAHTDALNLSLATVLCLELDCRK